MVNAIPNHQQLQDTVAQIVKSTLRTKAKALNLDDPLLASNGHFDSFALMELVLQLEETFSIEIPDDDLDPNLFYSINTITDYIQNRLAG